MNRIEGVAMLVTYSPEFLGIAELDVVLGDLIEDTEVVACLVQRRYGGVTRRRKGQYMLSSEHWLCGERGRLGNYLQNLHDGGLENESQRK